jgi:hypothetical protein
MVSQAKALDDVRAQYGASEHGGDDAKYDAIGVQRALVDKIKRTTMERMRTVEAIAAGEIAPTDAAPSHREA